MDYTDPAGNPDLARLFEEVGGPAGATSSLTNSAAFSWRFKFGMNTTLPKPYAEYPNIGKSLRYLCRSRGARQNVVAELARLPAAVSLLHATARWTLSTRRVRLCAKIYLNPRRSSPGIGAAAMMFRFGVERP